MTEYIENPLSGKLRGVTYEDGRIIDVHIRDTDGVVKVFVPMASEKEATGLMDVREKLVELIGNIYLPMMDGHNTIGEYNIPHKFKEKIADYLISNGVTVHEWISVDDRLPDNKEHDWVLAQVVEDNGYMHIPRVMEYRQAIDDWFEETYGWLSEHNGAFTVTHWMPLPEPPKGAYK